MKFHYLLMQFILYDICFTSSADQKIHLELLILCLVKTNVLKSVKTIWMFFLQNHAMTLQPKLVFFTTNLFLYFYLNISSSNEEIFWIYLDTFLWFFLYVALCPNLLQWLHLPKNFLFPFSFSDLFISGHLFFIYTYTFHMYDIFVWILCLSAQFCLVLPALLLLCQILFAV